MLMRGSSFAPVRGLLGFRLRCGSSAEKREGGCGGEMGGKLANIGFHVRIQIIVKAEGIHFPEGLIGGPVLLSDAVGGHQDAGAVIAVGAMDEDTRASSVLE